VYTVLSIFLKDFIYPIIKNNCIIHASFNNNEGNCKQFPIIYDVEYHFVGEYVYYNEERSQEHIDILKKNILN
jgi:uncharacterized protein YrzB (UPF0473 family)